jgi:hypothetical protein
MTDYQVRMTAYDSPRIRTVHIPDDELTGATEHDLELIFRYGQNDFQPQNCYSVSVGDVVELGDQLYMVKAMGYKLITQEEYDEYLALDERKRWFIAHSD